MKHKHSNDRHAEEPWLLHLIDQLSTAVWVGLWMATILLSAIAYWATSSYMEGHGLACTMHREMEAPVSFPTALYFSCVTTTTLGYGDFAPEGISRVIAIFQAFLGMAVVGAVISKILTRHQGQTIVETNSIAVAEQSANVFASLNQQLVEFQEIGRSYGQVDLDKAEQAKLVRRWANAELRFNFLLDTIQPLLRKPEIDSATKEKFLQALGNTVAEFGTVRKMRKFSADSTASTSQLQSICECSVLQSELPENRSIEEIRKWLSSIDDAV